MVNNEIKAKEVRLVNNDTKGITQMSTEEALKLADEQGLDLICISEKDEVPVVKIGNYKKFLYEKQKKDKENKKKARLSSQETKEIQISDVIAEHDLEIKANSADRIIKEGNKINLSFKTKIKTLFYNPIFIISYIPCAIKGLTKKEVTWSKVKHGDK